MSKNVLPMFSSKSFIASSLTFTAILLWGIYPEKTIIPKDMCIPLFTVALSTVVRICKQPKCPSTEEQANGLGLTYTHLPSIKQVTNEDHVSQRTLLSALWGPKSEGDLKKRGQMYKYSCVHCMK